jgi:hypothetical protein
MSAKINAAIIISPIHQEWKASLVKNWEESTKLYDESKLLNAMYNIDLNLKILKNIRAINYFPEAITNLYKYLCIIGNNRHCKPTINTDPYDCFPRILFSVAEAYTFIWCIDGNYYRVPTYLDDCKDSIENRKLKAFFKCTAHIIAICYHIIKADERILEYRNEYGKSIIDVMKQGIEKADSFSYSQFCQFFRNIEDLI